MLISDVHIFMLRLKRLGYYYIKYFLSIYVILLDNIGKIFTFPRQTFVLSLS